MTTRSKRLSVSTRAAQRVLDELTDEANELEQEITSRYLYVPGKVYTPKRNNKTKGYVAGAPMTRLTDFNPTSRQHIAWALQNFRGARTKVTDTGKPKVDEAVLLRDERHRSTAGQSSSC